MKKIVCIALAVLMVCSLAACGAKQEAPAGSLGDWTREGAYQDEAGNILSIGKMDNDGTEGWYVSAILGEAMDMYGGFIAPDGNQLKGELPDVEKDGAIDVTVSEDGEDGVLLEIKGGETYHFAPAPPLEGYAEIMLNTEGLGQVAYAEEGGEPEFDDEYPAQSAQLSLIEGQTYVFAAKPDEGWKFVKWTKDGADFSTDEQITVPITEDAEYVAIFDLAS